jgi:hypothetical protein
MLWQEQQEVRHPGSTPWTDSRPGARLFKSIVSDKAGSRGQKIFTKIFLNTKSETCTTADLQLPPINSVGEAGVVVGEPWALYVRMGFFRTPGMVRGDPPAEKPVIGPKSTGVFRL